MCRSILRVTTTSRTLRITNIRANAHAAGPAAAGNFVLSQIVAQISINGNTSLSVNNPQQVIAYVSTSLSGGITTSNTAFLQCVGEPKSNTTPSQVNGAVPTFTFTEGFGSAWKAKNIAHILNTTGNGFLPVASSYWAYDGFNTFANGTINYPKDYNQNVPGAIYNTESGFICGLAFGGATLDSVRDRS